MGEVGARPSDVNAVRHGATAERQYAPVARVHQRRVMRQLGLKAADLDPIGIRFRKAPGNEGFSTSLESSFPALLVLLVRYSVRSRADY